MFVSRRLTARAINLWVETGGPARSLSSKNLLRFQAKISLFVSERPDVYNFTA